MNVYDFDNTIFRGDSTVRLTVYVMLHRPAALVTLPPLIWGGAMYLLRLWPKQRFKERVYAFCRHIPDMDELLDDFWDKNRGRIYDWYMRKKQPDDLIISASSQFALRPICDSLGVRLIASEVDAKSGKYIGKNCHGEEKLRRFREAFPDGEIDEFYSDSRSDAPLAGLARQAYIVRKGKISEW